MRLGLKGLIVLGVLTAAALGGTASWAIDQVPDCMAYSHSLPINNDEVLHWKRTTPNSFLERAHVKGEISYVYPDRNGHEHFEIKIGSNDNDTVEIIYNQDFGEVPDTHEGMLVEACGDYITSINQSGPYPPSPDGAIVHWVHFSPNLQKHPSGFLMIDGILYGQDTEHAGPKRHEY